LARHNRAGHPESELTMFGLDDFLASFSDGATLGLVILVAVLLGLRHATDPDHLAAVTTLIASTERRAHDAARLGLAWGAGHALTLFALGVPIVLYRAYLPEVVQRGAETAIGFLIAGLAVWLLLRWRRGAFHAHTHTHGSHAHAHLHSHRVSAHDHGRTPLGAFSIGLLHGIGGSAGVGILLVSTIEDKALAIAALGILAAFTAVSMTLLTTGLGLTLARGSIGRLAPALGAASLAFGLWYALGAQNLLPYYL
jgi:ABC-type nickel/cobalt efflux system permease component RcnA